MQLAVHEEHDLNELTFSCVNSITNMALFINQANGPHLKSLLLTLKRAGREYSWTAMNIKAGNL